MLSLVTGPPETLLKSGTYGCQLTLKLSEGTPRTQCQVIHNSQNTQKACFPPFHGEGSCSALETRLVNVGSSVGKARGHEELKRNPPGGG